MLWHLSSRARYSESSELFPSWPSVRLLLISQRLGASLFIITRRQHNGADSLQQADIVACIMPPCSSPEMLCFRSAGVSISKIQYEAVAQQKSLAIYGRETNLTLPNASVSGTRMRNQVCSCTWVTAGQSISTSSPREDDAVKRETQPHLLEIAIRAIQYPMQLGKLISAWKASSRPTSPNGTSIVRTSCS